MGEPDPRKMKSSLYQIWQRRKAKREARLRPLEESIPDYEEFERGIAAQGFASSPQQKKRGSIPDYEEFVRGVRGQGFVSSPKKKPVSYHGPYADQAEACPCPQLAAVQQGVQDAGFDNYYEDSLEVQQAAYDDYYQDSLENDSTEYDSLEDGSYVELYDSLKQGPAARGTADRSALEDSLEELKAEVDRVIDMATAILESHSGADEEAGEAVEDQCPCPEELQAFRQQENLRYHRPRPRRIDVQKQQRIRKQPQRQRNARYQCPPPSQLDMCCCAEDLQALRMQEQWRQRRARSPAAKVKQKCPCNKQEEEFWLH